MQGNQFLGRSMSRWVQLLLVLGTLAIVAVLGLVFTRERFTSQPLLVLGVASVPLLLFGLELVLRYPDLQVLVLLLAAAFVPVSVSIPTGTGSAIVASFLLSLIFAAFWLLKMLITDRRSSLLPSPLNRPILAFMLIVLLSLVWGTIFRDPLVFTPPRFFFVQLASGLTMITLPGTLLFVEHFLTLRSLKIAVGIMLAVGILGGLVRFANLPLPVNTEGIAGAWIIGLSMGLFLFKRRLSWPQRVALLILAGAWLVWNFVLHPNRLSPWLADFVMLGILLFRRSKGLAIGLAVMLGAVFVLNYSYYQNVISGKQVESGDTRYAAWQYNWQITSQHLLLGTGPAGYAVYYMSYFPTDAVATHSNYIDVLSETGVIGFGVYIWLFAVLVWEGYKLCRRLEGRGDFAEAMANVAFAGTIACLVVMGFGDWLLPFAYTQTIMGYGYVAYSWLFMGMTLLINRLVPPEAGAAPPSLPTHLLGRKPAQS